jgi:hypothetical protein
LEYQGSAATKGSAAFRTKLGLELLRRSIDSPPFFYRYISRIDAPRQKLLKVCERLSLGQLFENVPQVTVRFQAIEFGGFEQTVEIGAGLGAVNGIGCGPSLYLVLHAGQHFLESISGIKKNLQLNIEVSILMAQ